MCVGLIDDRPGGRTEKAGAEIPVVYGEQGTAYIIPERGMIPHGLKNTLLHKTETYNNGSPLGCRLMLNATTEHFICHREAIITKLFLPKNPLFLPQITF